MKGKSKKNNSFVKISVNKIGWAIKKDNTLRPLIIYEF